MRIGVLGINFKTASLELREAIARGAEVLSGERGLFFIHPIVLLSTCNRTEIYFSGEDLAAAHSDLLATLRTHIKEPFEHRLYSYFGIDCFTHLCRVTAGLDSAILAETEIQRQVKVAYMNSASSLPSSLHYAFQKALKVGKSVRSQIALERGSPSLYSTIWKLSEEFYGTLLQKKILLVGYSELNRALASFFLHRGLSDLTICTKNPENLSHPGSALVGRKELDRWDAYDIVVCASKAGEPLIRKPSSTPKLLFDLSVPRNIDPILGSTSRLYNIDQLIQESRRASDNDLTFSETYVRESVLRLAKIYREKQEFSIQFSHS
ncbi:MAG: glutamyl-tRNA reductase [Verrucomicrobia bacterium]|nr:glutamyl-tRNA reductase [Verrucomicrobiota bacterium]